MRRFALPLVAAPILFLLILTFANATTLKPIPLRPIGCPFSVSPIVDKSGSEVTLTFFFNSMPPYVNFLPYTMKCNGNECDIYVTATGPSGNCIVLWMTHKDTHTYTIPGNVPGPITNICIYVNGNEVLCADPQAWPAFDNGNAPVGGTVVSVDTAHLLAPWLLLSSIVAVPALAIYFAKRR